MTRILTVGCGITGSSFNFFLKQALQQLHLPSSAVVQDCWEARQVLGGRFENHRLNSAFGDLGAQYFTNFRGQHNDVFSLLEAEGLLVPFDARSGLIDGVKESYQALPHYYAPQGTSSLAAHFAREGLQQMQLGRAISSLAVNEGKLRVTSEDLAEAEYDVVVLAGTATKVAEIEGMDLFSPGKELEGAISVKALLAGVKYSSRLALSVVYSVNTEDMAEILASVAWRGKYISDDIDTVIRYVSIENFKFDSSDSSSTYLSILVHSSVPYGLQYLQSRGMKDSADEEATQDLLQRVERVLPGLRRIRENKKDVCLRVWEQSQVTQRINLPASLQCLPLTARVGNSHRPLVVLAGDYFTESNIQGCFSSARMAAEIVAQHIAAQHDHS